MSGIPTRAWWLLATALAVGCDAPPVAPAVSSLQAPSALSVRELASGDLVLTWQDNSTGETSFDLQRSATGPGGRYVPLATVPADVSTYEDAQVDGLSDYCYRLRALAPAGEAPSDFSSAACHQSAPPAAPTQLAATAGFGQVDLTWQDNADDEAGFEVWRSTTGAGGPFTLDAALVADQTGYSATGLADGAEYCYRVRATGPKGQPSAFSGTVCATTPVPQVPPPRAPSDLVATLSEPTTIALRWSDHATDEAGFEVWRSTTGATGAFSLLATRPANDTDLDDRGLAPGTQYCYEVRAIGGAGVPPSPFAPVACATTPSPPAAPTGLGATVTAATTVGLAWTDNASDEAGFEIWRSLTGPSGTFTQRATRAANATAYSDTGLAAGAQYCYRVRATSPVAGVPPSDYTAVACATTPAAPAAPTQLAASAGGTSRVNLAWRDNATDEAEYEVWSSTTGSGGTYAWRATVPADGSSYTDSGLSPSTQYCYKVRAMGAGLAPDSPFTPPACATTADPVAVRIVLFGDSNTDRCEELPTTTRRSSYVSIYPSLDPSDPPQSCSVPAKVLGGWAALRTDPLRVVNHGIASTTTGGGLGGGPDRTSQGAPNARTVVNGLTRFEGEMLGAGYPWSGGEPVNSAFPKGPVLRVNAYAPGASDFAYVSMGTNDDAGPTRTLTAQQTLDNLRWMIGRWTAAGGAADHFVLTTLPPRDDANSPTSIPDRNTGIRALAAELGVHLIDLAAYVSDDNGATWRDPSLNIGDGIHYTEAVRTWLGGQVAAWLAAEVPAP